MKTDKRKIAFLYLRLSRDEYKNLKESDSIANQRLQITDYCKKMVDYLKKALIYGHTSRISS